jgi:hypothetical protein
MLRSSLLRFYIDIAVLYDIHRVVAKLLMKSATAMLPNM